MMPPRYKVGLSAKYHRLIKNPGDDGFVDAQFNRPPSKVPYQAIAMATVLFVLGSALIILGAFLLAGFLDIKYSDRTWPILIIGSLMFVPGAYHVRIAYYAWKGYNGYSYSDIPEVD